MRLSVLQPRGWVAHPTSRRHAILGLIIACLAMTYLASFPAPSHASACGYQYWGGFNSPWGWIPNGQLTHCIEGGGTFVDWDGANFGSVANICDSSMRFTYGYGAWRLDGNVHWGCSKVGQWKYSIRQNVPRGDACAELWAKNWRVRVTRQCHYVH